MMPAKHFQVDRPGRTAPSRPGPGPAGLPQGHQTGTWQCSLCQAQATQTMMAMLIMPGSSYSNYDDNAHYAGLKLLKL